LASAERHPGQEAEMRLRLAELLALAAWFGLAAGLLEVLTKVVCTAAGRGGRLYQMSRHFFWLIPLTNVLMFLIFGLVLAVFARMFPRAGRWFSLRWFVALAILPSFLVAGQEIHDLAWFLVAWGLAVQLARRIERHAKGFRRVVAFGFPVLVAIELALVGFVFGREWLKESRETARALPKAGALNVVLVTLDTVRADRLSLYGYPRPTSFTLDQIARRGIRFDRALATAPWTLASHGSVFTGRLPHELKADWLAPIDASFPTLAGYLADRGYATSGFVANTLYCGYDTGLADGFTHYEDYTLPALDAFFLARLSDSALRGFFRLHNWVKYDRRSDVLDRVLEFVNTHVFSGKRKDAESVNRAFFDWLSKRQTPERPFFAFLNYIDAHDPYILPGDAHYRFGSPPASLADFLLLEKWEALDKPSLDERYTTLASDCYDNCIYYIDLQLNRLISALGERGLLDQTILIVTGDHGEGFGEHDLYVHGESLYSSEIHVPLLIVLPPSRSAVGVVSEPVSLRDLPATVVDLLDLGGGSPFPGHSLVGRWDRSKPTMEAPIVAELGSPNPFNPNQGRSPAKDGPLVSVTIGDFTYIRGPGKEELFNQKTDPHERKNLVRDDAARSVLLRLKSELERNIPAGKQR